MTWTECSIRRAAPSDKMRFKGGFNTLSPSTYFIRPFSGGRRDYQGREGGVYCVCVRPAHLCSVFPPAAQEFIHRKCAGSIMPDCLIQSDTESLLRGEVSMSGRSSQGMQTVDKIFNMPL